VSFYDTEPEYADPGRLRDEQERVDPPTCDDCGRTIGMGLVSLEGVGIFCSHKCANRGALKHEARMSRPSLIHQSV
jgi:hypothetical protein